MTAPLRNAIRCALASFVLAIGWAAGGCLLQQAPAKTATMTNPLEGSEQARLAGAKLYARECASCRTGRRGSWKGAEAQPARRLQRSAWNPFLGLAKRVSTPRHALVRASARAATLADRLLYQVPGRGTSTSGFPASEVSAARNYGFVFAASLRIIANRTPASARPVSAAFAALT